MLLRSITAAAATSRPRIFCSDCKEIRHTCLYYIVFMYVCTQAGTNRYATQSQSGVVMGGVRHAADIRADDLSMAGQGVIGLQAGSNRGATQAGMSMGGVRHAGDIRADDLSKDGYSVIGLQAGSNRGATQAGMTFGGVRHAGDMPIERIDDLSRGVSKMQPYQSYPPQPYQQQQPYSYYGSPQHQQQYDPYAGYAGYGGYDDYTTNW